MSNILDRVRGGGFEIVRQEWMQLTRDQAAKFYAEHEGRSFFDKLCEFMSSGPVVALSLRRPDAIKGWRSLCGPTNSDRAREESPGSLRALYGLDGSYNAVHGSDSVQSVERETALVFGEFAGAGSLVPSQKT